MRLPDVFEFERQALLGEIDKLRRECIAWQVTASVLVILLAVVAYMVATK